MRDFSLSLALGVVFCLAFSSNVSAQNPGQPNFIVVMADDLDQGSFDALLNRGLLPHIQGMMDHGVTFSESFVTNALCCPSRATLLTGQYTHNHSTYTNGRTNGSIRVFDDSNTLPVWLQKAGYTTGYVGKYLNDYGKTSKFLFDQAALDELRLELHEEHPGQAHIFEASYRPPGWNTWNGLLGVSTYCNYNFMINMNDYVIRFLKNGSIEHIPLNEDGNVSGDPKVLRLPAGDSLPHNYQTDVLSWYATRFIEERAADGAPFLLAVMPLAPHVEVCNYTDPDGPLYDLSALFEHTIRPAWRHQSVADMLAVEDLDSPTMKPSFNEADTLDKPLHAQWPVLDDAARTAVLNQYGDRLASMLAVDQMVGQLVAMLEAKNLDNATYIIFTSDNGWFYGEHRRTEKGTAYEEAIRVPLVIRVPSEAIRMTVDGIALNNDLAPTIMDLAGAKPGLTMDGRSLRPLIEDSATAWTTRRQRFLVEHYLREGTPNWRFPGVLNLFAVRTAFDAVILGNRSFGAYFPGFQGLKGYYLTAEQNGPTGEHVSEAPVVAWEMYNLGTDPYELDNQLTVTLLGCDTEFESEISGCWAPHLFGSGAGRGHVPEAAHTGERGLIIFTGAGDEASGAHYSQELPASEGNVFSSDVFARSMHQYWPKNAMAHVQLQFRDASGVVLSMHQSEPITSEDMDWRIVGTGHHMAPAHTASVRVQLTIEKTSGPMFAAAYFDELRLRQFESADKQPSVLNTALKLQDDMRALIRCRGVTCRVAEDSP